MDTAFGGWTRARAEGARGRIQRAEGARARTREIFEVFLDTGISKTAGPWTRGVRYTQALRAPARYARGPYAPDAGGPASGGAEPRQYGLVPSRSSAERARYRGRSATLRRGRSPRFGPRPLFRIMTDHSQTHFRNPKIRLKKTGQFTTEIVNKHDFVGPTIFITLNVFELFSSKNNLFIF